MAAETSSAPPLGKYLASTDKKTRDKAIRGLGGFLSSASTEALAPPEMARLWKGVFYCFWMSDKPRVQQALADELAALVLVVKSTDGALAFLGGFWEALVREWNGLDRLRMDKYYSLVRRFVNVTFRLLRKHAWDEALCAANEEILTRRGGPLCPDDPRIPTSLMYHIADVYLEELDKALASDEEADSGAERPPAPLDALVRPFFAIACRNANKTTCAHVQSTVLEPLLEDLHTAAASTVATMREGAPPASKRRRLAEDADALAYPHLCASSAVGKTSTPGEVRSALLKTLFASASAPETRDANRRRMYALWKELKGEDDEDDEDEE